MKIYFIRHGIAEEIKENQEDETRKLTDIGITKTTKVAEKLRNLDIKFNLILTSPLIRAKETGIILQKAQLSPKIIELSCLSPSGKIEDFLSWLSNSEYHQTEQKIALVGHQPNLTNWAELFLWGKIADKLTLKKAGIILLEITEINNPLGKAELLLLTSPKWMIDICET